MKVKNNLFRYMHGGIIGMCGEYLYRVGFCVWPLLVMCTTICLVIIDLTTKEK